MSSTITVNPRVTAKAIKDRIMAELMPMLVASLGVGKSSIVRQLARYYN